MGDPTCFCGHPFYFFSVLFSSLRRKEQMQSFYPKLLGKTVAVCFCYKIYFYYSQKQILLITETLLLPLRKTYLHWESRDEIIRIYAVQIINFGSVHKKLFHVAV